MAVYFTGPPPPIAMGENVCLFRQTKKNAMELWPPLQVIPSPMLANCYKGQCVISIMGRLVYKHALGCCILPAYLSEQDVHFCAQKTSDHNDFIDSSTDSSSEDESPVRMLLLSFSVLLLL